MIDMNPPWIPHWMIRILKVNKNAISLQKWEKLNVKSQLDTLVSFMLSQNNKQYYKWISLEIISFS